MAEKTSRSGKKVVRAPKSEPSDKAKELAKEAVKNNTDAVWKPTAEANSKATKFRVIAVIGWVIAIGIEAFAIFWLLKQDTEKNWFLWALIGALVAIAIFAIAGSLFWKKANDLDPAKRSEPVRFFVQNQLGVIISIIAFLPLIILIFTNKNMNSKQKSIAGVVAIVVALGASLLSADFSPNSVEDETAKQVADEGQIDEYTAIVEELTGANAVTWTLSGTVYHLCEDASAVNLDSADGQIYAGTVSDAHTAGKAGLTLEVAQELGECGLAVPDNLSEIEARVRELRDTATP